MKRTSPTTELIEAVQILHIIMHGEVPYRQQTLWSHQPACPYESPTR